MPRSFFGHQSFKGRGVSSNVPGRFDSLTVEQCDDGWYQDEIVENLSETVLPDRARSVITSNDSPDVGFEASINPYRGCSHGCIYCFARPTHAYLGLSPGLDFETKLFYKADAANILRTELSKPKYVCKPIALGINTDGYQPLEKRLEVTRGILGVLAECRHPVTIVTKSALIIRDIDLLKDLAKDAAGVGDVERHFHEPRYQTHSRAKNRLAAGAVARHPAIGRGRNSRRRAGGARYSSDHRS